MAQQPQIMPPEYDPEDEDGRMTDSADLGALTQLNAAEINQQILTARAFPRSINSFRKQMREMATLDEEVAQSCLYALKRGNKVIEGPSARFAELAVQCWGNTRAGARVVDIGAEFITAQGMFYDLEKNMAVSYEVLRRITDKDGKRYGDDMIGVTGNAACSIAIRNAILKGIPKAIWNDAYQAARSVGFGGGETIGNRRLKMLEAFQPWGIKPEQIFAMLGVKGIEDVTIDQMIFMGGIRTAIKEGDTTAEQAFAPENMLVPGQAVPPRPNKGGFARDDKQTGKKPEEPKPQAEQAKPEAPQTQQRAAEPTPQTEDESQDTSQRSTSTEYEDWYKDQMAELPKIEKIRDLADFRTMMLDQADGPVREKDIQTRCDARQQEIMAKAKKK